MVVQKRKQAKQANHLSLRTNSSIDKKLSLLSKTLNLLSKTLNFSLILLNTLLCFL